MQRLATLMFVAASAATLPAQYAWDEADGVGVRYQIYKKLAPIKIDPKRFPDQLRMAYTPKNESDFIRIKGYPIAWGVYVYEFPPQPKDAAKDAPKGLKDFLANHDPTRQNREFLVDGKPVGKDSTQLYYEFTDRFVNAIEVLDSPKPGGRLRYAVCEKLGIRFIVDKTMGAVEPNAKQDGPHGRGSMLAASSEWLRVPGRDRPQSWDLDVLEFGGPAPKSKADKQRFYSDYAAYVGAAFTKSFRTVDAEGRVFADGKGKLWRYQDKRAGMVEHHVAASYKLGDREIALDVRLPAGPEGPPEKLVKRAEKMVSSLTPWTPGKGAEDRGMFTYHVASSCKLGDREVGFVVYVPCAKGKQPSRQQLTWARKMARSLAPAEVKDR